MSYRLIRESFPSARKQYRCIWCGEAIPVGEKHRHEISYYDAMQDFRWHIECNTDAEDYFRTMGESDFLPYQYERPAKSAD